MEQEIMDRLKSPVSDYQKVNYLSLYFNALATGPKGKEKARITLEVAKGEDDNNVLKAVLPEELRRRVKSLAPQPEKTDDLNIIHQIEKAFNITLNPASLEDVFYGDNRNTYSIGHNGKLTGLNLYLDQAPPIAQVRDLIHSTEKGWKYITHMNLSKVGIVDISFLKDMINLSHLNLWDNQIADISVLENLKKLTYLNLSRNHLKDLFPLRTLTELETLILQRNKIKDLSPVQDLTKIKTLNLTENQIQELQPLDSLTSLQSLNLINNLIQNIPLDFLNSLPPIERALSFWQPHPKHPQKNL
ncbi:MAG: leucine-rich repeat domain-containing protein [Bacteroidia bacterium]|nr:leucine-rich repeat domain-containing protein [Bacteroidia bacterium]